MTSSTNVNKPGIVCFGEILWDILPTKALPGGAPMNVAYHLHQLGQAPALLTRIGVDQWGKGLLDILEQKHIDVSHIQLDYNTPTGIVHATPNELGDMSYDIVAPAAWDNIVFDSETETLIKNADYFIFGSLIGRGKISRDTLIQALEVAQNKILDINLRTPYFNRSIVEQLLTKADVVKMNISELELITGWFANYKHTRERIELIQEKFGIRSVIITMGGDGAMINYRGDWYSHPGFTVKVADTIGSGDSFLAGFISQILSNKTPEVALEFASGLGAFVASKTGGWPDYSIHEIHELIAGNNPALIP